MKFLKSCFFLVIGVIVFVVILPFIMDTFMSGIMALIVILLLFKIFNYADTELNKFDNNSFKGFK